MTELAPCPKCGSVRLVFEATRNVSDEPMFVKCKECKYKGPRGIFIAQAAEKWNRLDRRERE